ncbi:MAG TPA: EcsC family protein, partial [Beijerinckiaceae bacterium]|nr:EcsC family protein [Beijerinckiaceae bacterium]
MSATYVAQDAPPAELPETALSQEDWAALSTAVRRLERSSLAMRLAHVLDRQVKLASSIVPPSISANVSRAVSLALRAAMKAAIRSLGQPAAGHSPSPMAHRAMAIASGAAGGALGLATLPIELPISTTLMLRSIADVARSEGEDLADPEAALACLEVFALGGEPQAAPWESGYFAVRALLAKTVSEAARYILNRGVVEEGAPILVRLGSLIASRFGAVVTQKALAQAVPVVGAVSGGAINYAFMEHFQTV